MTDDEQDKKPKVVAEEDQLPIIPDQVSDVAVWGYYPDRSPSFDDTDDGEERRARARAALKEHGL